VLRVRGVDPGAGDRARAILAALSSPPGAPNWYGEQRFGRDGDNAARGKALVTGARPLGRDRRLDRLMISALQSQLFNDWLTARIGDGLYRAVVSGDVLHKRGGGMFVCDDPATDQARLAAGELVVTGPMFGDRMRLPGNASPALAREAEVLARAGLPREAFSSVRALAEGTRRDAAIEVAGATVAALDGSTLEIGFALPGGAYATAVMREVMKGDQPVDADPPAA
jgi:tRNA pseudouridine13 synthase